MASVPLTSWHTATTRPDLKPGSVHLWRFPLSNHTPLPDILNRDEKERAKRLRIPDKARAFVLARTCLRQILGGYLDVAPEHIEFSTGEHGKPALAGTHENAISFNLSHSGAWGVCGVALSGSIGIDVEYINPDLKFIPLAERFFSPEEKLWLLSSADVRQRRNFFRLWTRKEAWLKGKGRGFSEPELGLDPAHLSGKAAYAHGWFLMNLLVARGYVGGLAVFGEVEGVERFHFCEGD